MPPYDVIEVEYPFQFRLTAVYPDGLITYRHFDDVDTAVYWGNRYERSDNSGIYVITDVHDPEQRDVWVDGLMTDYGLSLD